MSYDNLYPDNQATATVTIEVSRNENKPRWTNENPIRIEVNETVPLGYVISNEIAAIDDDNVSRTII